MSAATMPVSAFWVPEMWFEPAIRGCLRRGTPTVLFVVLQSRREAPLVDVVLDLFHIELHDADGREHLRAIRFDVGSMDARFTVDLESGLEPGDCSATAVHDVTVLGRLRGRDAASGTELSEAVAFRSDGEDGVYLHPAAPGLALGHPLWATAATIIL